MNELVIMHDQRAVTSSLRVAEVFGKQHKDVLETVKNLVAENSAAKFFAEGTYKSRGKEYPLYFMNRDGFSLLAMGFTGKEALKFKIQYIQAFDSMEATLKRLPVKNWIQRSRPSWQSPVRRPSEPMLSIGSRCTLIQSLRSSRFLPWPPKS
jgi:Rha family phage regulatory protein